MSAWRCARHFHPKLDRPVADADFEAAVENEAREWRKFIDHLHPVEPGSAAAHLRRN